ncbi:MAG: alpha/beta hydrolase [Clostridia bacterium]|nr:alpha/beta hydrolase [Clostridia bacterium]
MKQTIDPGKERRTINFIDNICFSHVYDLDGNPLDLYLSLMVQNGNSEMRLASGRDDEVSTGLQPLIVWINGAGWRQCDKNLMAAEMSYFAERGYAVACIQYRHSAQGHFPAQLIDVKTAVRFLRAHAAKYSLDPERIAAMGRSAGGHLASWMAMNTDGFDTDEWSGYSSHVQAAVDFFGPVDVKTCNLIEQEKFSDPNHRWHKLEETHGGALVGGDPATMIARSDAASPIFHISEKTAPIIILHGDQDPLVPLSMSEDFYDRLVRAGLESQTELYIVRNGGHGTRELFQNEVKERVLAFLNQYLKKR